MGTLTKDFTGSYDWPAEEARLEAEKFRELADTEGIKYAKSTLPKVCAHWRKVFGTDDQGQADMVRFIEVLQNEIPELKRSDAK